jgi:hypothetical protein
MVLHGLMQMIFKEMKNIRVETEELGCVDLPLTSAYIARESRQKFCFENSNASNSNLREKCFGSWVHFNNVES